MNEIYQVGRKKGLRCGRMIERGSGFFFVLFFLFLLFLGLYLWQVEIPRLGLNAASGLHHSYSNARSQLSFRPIPQLTTMPDP